jgi:hypothetical protein
MGNVLIWLIAWCVSSAGTAAVFAWWVQALEQRAGGPACAVVAVRPELERQRA